MLTIWLIEIKIIYSTVNLAKKILMKHEMSSFFSSKVLNVMYLIIPNTSKFIFQAFNKHLRGSNNGIFTIIVKSISIA